MWAVISTGSLLSPAGCPTFQKSSLIMSLVSSRNCQRIGGFSKPGQNGGSHLEEDRLPVSALGLRTADAPGARQRRVRNRALLQDLRPLPVRFRAERNILASDLWACFVSFWDWILRIRMNENYLRSGPRHLPKITLSYCGFYTQETESKRPQLRHRSEGTRLLRVAAAPATSCRTSRPEIWSNFCQ